MPGESLSTFAYDVSKFVEKCKGKEEQFLRELTQDILLKIIIRNPVDTGFCRNSWYVTIGSPSGNPSPPTKGQQPDKDGGKAKIEAILQLANAKIGDVIYVLNNCEYVEKLEYGIYTPKTPGTISAMVRTTLSEVESIADDAVRRLAEI